MTLIERIAGLQSEFAGRPAVDFMVALLFEVANAEVEGEIPPGQFDRCHPIEDLPAVCEVLCERLELMRSRAARLDESSGCEECCIDEVLAYQSGLWFDLKDAASVNRYLCRRVSDALTQLSLHVHVHIRNVQEHTMQAARLLVPYKASFDRWTDGTKVDQLAMDLLN